MKIHFWGTRGSIPSPGPPTVRYGGNTSCVEVRLEDGTMIILDAGSGIRELGNALGPYTAHLLVSHYHWDHIQGLPFFLPAYLAGSAISVLGPLFEDKGPREHLSGQMTQPYFPAPASQWEGVRGFDVTPEGPFEIGSATVRATQLSHPSNTLGYRIEEEGSSLVYMSDDEVDLASPEMFDHIVSLTAGADVLLHDCQFFEEEYRTRQGFGHSTPRQAVRVALEAGVGRLVLFHHDPTHTDEQVELLAEQARELAPDLDVAIGAEGTGMSVGKPVVARRLRVG